MGSAAGPPRASVAGCLASWYALHTSSRMGRTSRDLADNFMASSNLLRAPTSSVSNSGPWVAVSWETMVAATCKWHAARTILITAALRCKWALYKRGETSAP